MSSTDAVVTPIESAGTSVAPSNPPSTSDPVVQSSTPPAESSTSAVQTSEPPAQTSSAPPTEPTSNPPTEPSNVPTSNGGNNSNPPTTSSSSNGNVNPPQTTGGGSTDNTNTNGSGVTTGNTGSQPTGGSNSGTSNTAGGSNAQTTEVNKDGQTVVIVYETVTSNGVVYTTAVSSSLPGNNKSGSSHVGAIVGGTVGGVVGLLAVLVFLFILLRKRKRNYRDDFDDMMFDPARSQNHGPIDLSDDQGAPTIDPYEYKPVPGIASTLVTPQQQEMAQVSYPHSGSDGLSRAPTSSAATSAGYAGYGAGANAAGMAGYGAGMNAFPEPRTQSGSSPISPNSSQGAPMSAKQLEAYQEAQRFRVQNPSAGPSGGLTVHEDGGAYSEAGPSDGNEIPPTYDSIRR